jgi:hypothetical protein
VLWLCTRAFLGIPLTSDFNKSMVLLLLSLVWLLLPWLAQCWWGGLVCSNCHTPPALRGLVGRATPLGARQSLLLHVIVLIWCHHTGTERKQ